MCVCIISFKSDVSGLSKTIFRDIIFNPKEIFCEASAQLRLFADGLVVDGGK